MNFPAASPDRANQAAKTKLTRLDRRCVIYAGKLRISSPPSWRVLAGQVVIEDLDVAAMKQGMGRRAFRRAVSDAAMGLIRPQLSNRSSAGAG